MAGFEVDLEDGRKFELERATVADQISFERKFGVSAGQLADDTRLEWLTYLVWTGLKRKGVDLPEFDVFVPMIVDLRVEVPEGKASTNGEQPSGSSQAS